MVREAEENAEADSKRKEETEIKNKAESFINDIDIAMQEKGATMDPTQKEQTQKLRDELKNRLDELEKAAAYMQQAQAGNPNPGAQASDQPMGSNPDDVVDADFTNKDNN